MAEASVPHKLDLDNRKKLTMSGVLEVISFDDTSVVMRTGLGTLVVQGSGLQLKTLTLDGGNVVVEGQVDGLLYAQPERGGGWLRRLLG